jgi:uncharacterized protein (DUF849 family)
LSRCPKTGNRSDPSVQARRGIIRRVPLLQACGVPVGVATGAWVEPDAERRAALVAAWREPDYASVNLSEPGAAGVMRALADTGIGVEAGVWSPEDAERLAAAGVAVLRVLVEIIDAPAGAAVGRVREIEAALDRLGIAAPRLLHGEEETCWPILRHARATGRHTRVGLEDTLALPDGTPAPGNEALVRAALAL